MRDGIGEGREVIQFGVVLADLAVGQGGTLRIFDVRGRLRKTLASIERTRQLSLSWDGRGENGILLPAGVYFATFTDGAHRLVRKFVLAK